MYIYATNHPIVHLNLTQCYISIVSHNCISKSRKKSSKISSERESITINLPKIKRIIKEYYEQLYINNLDNLNEMEKLLKLHRF